jgi:hypothetical protein
MDGIGEKLGMSKGGEDSAKTDRQISTASYQQFKLYCPPILMIFAKNCTKQYGEPIYWHFGKNHYN